MTEQHKSPELVEKATKKLIKKLEGVHHTNPMPVEQADKKHEVVKIKTVFIAIYPDRAGKVPEYVDLLSKKYLVLHPSYDFENENGLETLKKLGEVEPPHLKETHPFRRILTRDFWALEKSDCMLYDIDLDPGLHFLGAAVIYKKPIIFVSNILAAAPPYFSGFAEAVIKHDNIALAIRMLKI